MAKQEYFDPEERSREKAKSRAADEALLKSGAVSAAQLAKRNGLFSALDPAKAKILKRRARVRIG